MTKIICDGEMGSGVTLLPAIYFGCSERCWWLYISFIRGRLGVMVYP
jgi:hypothetical protein